MSRGKSLTRYEVDAIKRLTDLGLPTRDICALTGRSDTTVQKIRSGRREERAAKRKALYFEKEAQSEPEQVAFEGGLEIDQGSNGDMMLILLRIADTLERISKQLAKR